MVVHCPNCNRKLSQRTLLSGNTFGARQWTDSKMDAPMLPHYPDLARCPSCGGFLLFSQARKATRQPKGYNEPTNAPYTPDPTEEEWLDALAQGIFDDAEEEEYGRLQAWHAANDPRRETDETGSTAQTTSEEFSPRARANLEALEALLARKDDNPDALLLRAEIHRELGRFQESLDLLSRITDDDYAMPRDLIRQLSEQGDVLVRLLDEE
jgi:hypothetical protein